MAIAKEDRNLYEANMRNHNPALYNSNAHFVYADASVRPVLQLLDLQQGEQILDLGCGSGELTARLTDTVGETGSVWGTDANEKMLSKARTAHSKLHDKVFLADAQSLEVPEGRGLENSFDKVFTNATLHWCKRDPAGVIEGVKLFLKPGGAFVGEFGGFQNVCAVRSHLHQVLREHNIDPVPLDPWYFPTAEAYSSLLTAHGFTVSSCILVPRPTTLPTDLIGWLRTFARNSFLSTLSDEEAERIMQETSKRCEIDCRDEQGRDSVMYVRLRFAAHL